MEARPDRNRLYYLATLPSLYEALITSIGGDGTVPQRGLGSHRRREALRTRSGVSGQVKRTARPLFRAKTKCSASITTWARRRCRTSSCSASPTASSSRLEPPLRRSRADHRRGVDRRRGPRRLLRGSRRPARHGAEPHVAAARLIAMEPPSAFDADAVRDEKVRCSARIRPIAAESIGATVRGQYGAAGSMASRCPATARRRAWRPTRDRDLCLRCGCDRKLALGRRAVFAAHRQAAPRAVVEDRRLVSSARLTWPSSGACART